MTDMEAVREIEEALFTPALQVAVRRAQEEGRGREETMLAAANAYLNMLVPLLGGREAALAFLRRQVDFLAEKV